MKPPLHNTTQHYSILLNTTQYYSILHNPIQPYTLMKRLTIIFAVLLTATSIMAEEFKIGKLTFEIATPTTVELTDADNDITKVFLSDTIIYKGNSYTLTYIGYEAFRGCESLTSVTIPNSVTRIGLTAFEGCESLTSVTIPNSVSNIEYNAFRDCKSLTSVTIPNSVTRIVGNAFYGCKSLKSVTIPNSVKWIGDGAFEGTALYNDPANWENGALYIDNCLIKVEKDFVGHFRIKENTRVIADGAFYGCSSLTSMVVASGNSTYDSRDNCNAIIETATNTLIAGCQNTTIPNGVTSIEEEEFLEETQIFRQ